MRERARGLRLEPAYVEQHDERLPATDEFRAVVTAHGWEAFPSTPVLFQVVTSDDGAVTCVTPIVGRG